MQTKIPKIYKLKHKPTGLYFQPHKHRGSHLSKKGKIYQTKTNGLSTELKYAEHHKDFETRTFRVMCQNNSHIHKITKNILNWNTPKWQYDQIYAETMLKDWEFESVN